MRKGGRQQSWTERPGRPKACNGDCAGDDSFELEQLGAFGDRATLIKIGGDGGSERGDEERLRGWLDRPGAATFGVLPQDELF